MNFIIHFPRHEQQLNFSSDSDPYERDYVRDYDRVFHQALSQIFQSENCSNLSSDQIKSMIKHNLRQGEPVLSYYFPKKSFEKLPLLWIAVLGRYQKSAELLVRYDADVCESSGGLRISCHPLDIYDKSTVLHVLLQVYPSSWNDSFIRIIVAKNVAILQAQDDCGRTALHYAVKKSRSLELIEMFLEKGVDVNVADRYDETALLAAIKNNRADERLVPLLLRYGADVSAKDTRGYNCLHHLANASTNLSTERAVDLARVLIKKGASLEDKTKFGRDCPIHLAIEAGGNNVQLVETFLEKGADVNAANSVGATPLQLAIKSSKAGEMVPLLLQYGADVSIKDNKGHNVLHRLALVGSSLTHEEQVEVAKFLIDFGASLSDTDNANQHQPIHLAALHGKNELIKLFVDRGVDVNAPAQDGTFPLWLAVELHYSTDALKTLLRCGANIHLKRSSDGRTALHRACEVYNGVSIKLLLSAGADILAEDYENRTPFAVMMNNPKRDSLYIRLMVLKELALKKVSLNSSVELTDERTIEKYSEIQEKFENCIAEIDMMKSTRFMESCSLFDLLTKSHRQIALLMRNPEFKAGFRQLDREPFSAYAEDICEAFERAYFHHCKILEEEKMINEAFYNSLPDVIVRKVIHYILCDIDCCDETTTVECCAIIPDFYRE